MPRILRQPTFPSLPSEVGAYFAELAVALPIFLAFVFFFLWVAIQIQACMGFTTSVNNAVRLGATRGDSGDVGFAQSDREKGLIPALHQQPFWSGDAENILCHRVSAEQCKEYYNFWSDLLHTTTFAGLRSEEHYMIAYAVEGIRLAIGDNTVRYPCNPMGDQRTADDGTGCLDCRSLPSGALGTVPDDKLRLILECRYHPDSTLFQAAMRLLKSGDGDAPFIMERRMFFDKAIFNN